MTTVALLGGSFNPPHIAHQMACLFVLETCAVDAVWLVPTYRHVFGKPLAPWGDRRRMCELAAAPLGDRAPVSSVEAELGGDRSRTYDTLVALGERHPETAFRLVIGSDILGETDRWYRWDEIERRADPIVLARPGHPSRRAAEVALPDVSATAIRERLARGDSAVPLVSRAVMRYIRERGLYR